MPAGHMRDCGTSQRIPALLLSQPSSGAYSRSLWCHLCKIDKGIEFPDQPRIDGAVRRLLDQSKATPLRVPINSLSMTVSLSIMLQFVTGSNRYADLTSSCHHTCVM